MKRKSQSIPMNLYTLTTQEILERISKHCPTALYVYLHCLNRVDDDGSVFFSRAMVEEDMSEGWARFKNQVKKLARENLLEWHNIDGGIAITLADLEYDE